MPFDDATATGPRRGLALWSFIFTDPAEALQSCRVSAPTKRDAIMLIESAANRALVSGQTDPGKRVIVQNMGATRHPPGLVSVMRRGGVSA